MGRLSARPASKKCHFEKAVLLKENDLQRHLKNRKICLGSFSSVSTNFSILSSLSGRIHPHLGPEGQNSRSIDAKLMKNRHSKCEKCNFDPFFQPRKNFQKKKFFEVSARSQRVLAPCEEIFQNFDAETIKAQYRPIFGKPHTSFSREVTPNPYRCWSRFQWKHLQRR